MELMYLWISRYKIINNQGFNFGGELYFQYDHEKRTLKVEENKTYINGFFDIDNLDTERLAKVVNLTALVGENGAGKTTLLNFIKENLCDGAGGIKEPAIIIFKNSKKEDKVMIYHHHNIKIGLPNLKEFKYKFELNSYEEKINGTGVTIYPTVFDFSSTNFVFFSNIYDNKDEEEFGNMYNISTNYLTKADKRKRLEEGRVDNAASEVEIHRLSEVNRQSIFIKAYSFEKSKKYLNFELPEKIAIYPNVRKTGDKEKKKYKKFWDYINGLLQELEVSFPEDSKRVKMFKAKFCQAILVNFFHEIIGFVPSFDIESITKKIQNQNYDCVFKKVENFFEIIADNISDPQKRDLPNAILNILCFIDQYSAGRISPKANSLNLAVNDKEPCNLVEFMKHYEKSFIFNQYLDFDWVGKNLSSGEKALLNMFSRFYSTVNYEKRTAEAPTEKDILVLIDEGEIYLHPFWQKRFIDILIKFLKDIYGDIEREIQIILTSNSPFVVSDLPDTNVIFMKKGNNGEMILGELEREERTFAANIHTLLSDAFFMRGSLMGDFAKKKIKYVIDRLMSNKDIVKDSSEHTELRRIINLIGEPVLKNKLEEMLNEKVSLSDTELEIVELEKRLDYLKRKKNNDKD